MTPRFVWTPALDARLEELHGTGMAFKIIAFTLNQEFKTSLTRNAVIGRAHRNVLALRLPTPKKRGTRPKRSSKPKPITEAPPIAPPEPVPQAGRLLMRHLNRLTCHWPYGTKPPYTYCGKPTYAGTSFCREHCEIVYTKPRVQWT